MGPQGIRYYDRYNATRGKGIKGTHKGSGCCCVVRRGVAPPNGQEYSRGTPPPYFIILLDIKLLSEERVITM